MQVGGGVRVQAQRASDRVEDLGGRVVIAALFQPGVVLGADAGQQRELVAPEAGDAAPPAVGDADLVRSDQFPAGPQVLPDAVYAHATTVGPRAAS